jgi:hypothetical protein
MVPRHALKPLRWYFPQKNISGIEAGIENLPRQDIQLKKNRVSIRLQVFQKLPFRPAESGGSSMGGLVGKGRVT